MKTTNKLMIAAMIFALLQTVSVFHLDGLVIFFTGLMIISHLQEEKEAKEHDR